MHLQVRGVQGAIGVSRCGILPQYFFFVTVFVDWNHHLSLSPFCPTHDSETLPTCLTIMPRVTLAVLLGAKERPVWNHLCTITVRPI